MVHSLSRSPSKKAEEAHRWWVSQLHNRKCDYCEDWVPISGVNTTNNGVYCSQYCAHIHEPAIEFDPSDF